MTGSFPDIEAISKRWKICWAIQQSINANLTATEKLDRALGVFIMDEVELDDQLHENHLVVAAAVSAASKSGTHGNKAFMDAVGRLFTPKKKSLINRADTPTKRKAILVLPFLAVTALFSMYRDASGFGYLDELSLRSVLLLMASILCGAIAFSNLSEWVKNGSD